MITHIFVTNHVGDTLDLNLFNPYNTGLAVMEVDGLGPAEASIHTTDYSTIDGSFFNSAHISNREIRLKLRLIEKPTIEDTRHRVYYYFPIKKKIKMAVKTDKRYLAIEGYVKRVEPDIFSSDEEMEIVVTCPDPYFYSVAPYNVIFQGAEPLFEFPFSNEGFEPEIIMGNIIDSTTRVIHYEGDFDTGLIFYISFPSPTQDEIVLHNTTTYQQMTIDTSKIPSGILAGDEIIISTIRSQKSAKLLRNGQYSNIINALDLESDWINLTIGDNSIIFDSEADLVLELEYKESYAGI